MYDNLHERYHFIERHVPVGSLLRLLYVAVIPGFPDARSCGRLPRFGTLVPGAQGPEPMWSWYFSRTSDVTLGDYGRAVGRSL